MSCSITDQAAAAFMYALSGLIWVVAISIALAVLGAMVGRKEK
jgi:hypothetical protein